MAWFCKKCISEGHVDEEWLEADENGIVFDFIPDDDSMTHEICEGCGPGWFDRYGEPIIGCVNGSCEVDPEYKIDELEVENAMLKQRIAELEEREANCTREVVNIFESFIKGKPVDAEFSGNKKLVSLIYGYILKIKNRL
jgi:hypothetical protein